MQCVTDIFEISVLLCILLDYMTLVSLFSERQQIFNVIFVLRSSLLYFIASSGKIRIKIVQVNSDPRVEQAICKRNSLPQQMDAMASPLICEISELCLLFSSPYSFHSCCKHICLYLWTDFHL